VRPTAFKLGWLLLAAGAAAEGADSGRNAPIGIVPAVRGSVPDARASSPAPHVDVTLTPGAARPDGRIPGIGVTLVLSDVRAAAGEPLLCLPFVVFNVDTVATSLSITEAHDDQGAFAVTTRDQALSGTDARRCWGAEREVQGHVTVSYDAPVSNATGTRGAAPPIELRSDAGGVSGGGAVFLMMPPDDLPRRFAVRWNLEALTHGATGISSYGKDGAGVDEPLPPDSFTDAYFMAGSIGHYSGTSANNGFFGAWQGTPPFDAAALMQRGERLYGRYLDFFQPPGSPGFGVFLRHNPVNAGGGMGLHRSFILTFGQETDGDSLNGTLAHEMFHVFVGSLDAPQGLASSWFGEGLAVHYQRLLLLRTGQITPERFLESVNSTAARYYTNALIDTPNDEIPTRFWEDTRVRVLPYDRGSMYFAVLDHELRSASDGERSLDDLLRAMLAIRRAGGPMGQAAWVRLLDEELGARAVAQFEGMLAGAVMLPEPDAFGPCFTRTRKTLRRYQLGFEPSVLTENPRIVRGLVHDSAAARAGLEDGDEILEPVAQDAIQGDQHAWLELDIRRDEQTFRVRYRPRGEAVEAWQWKRRQGIPDEACSR
jgi:hypothetical protein